MGKRTGISGLIWRLLLAIFAFATLAQSQAIGPDEVKISNGPYPRQQPKTLRVSTELVEIDVVPRDSRGRAIHGLKQDDFEVYDDGDQRPVTAFSIAMSPAASALSPVAPAISGKPENTPNNQPQEIPSATGAPRSIALFFDDFHTNTGDLGRAKIAARRFLAHGLAHGDRIALFTSSATVSVDYTNDPERILAAMNDLQAHVRVSENGIASCPRITPYQAYLIVNNADPNAYDAALQEATNCNGPPDTTPGGAHSLNSDAAAAAALGVGPPTSIGISGQEVANSAGIRAQAEQTWAMTRQATLDSLEAIESVLDSLAKQPGSRMLVLVSSGFLSGTNSVEQDAVVARAVRSGTVINALDAKGLYAEVPGLPLGETSNGFSQRTMEALIFGSSSMGSKLNDLDAPIANFTQSTGGLFFRNNNDLDLGFREVGMVPEVTYQLAIEPAGDGKYHHLRVKVRGGNHEFVQARPGYFAPGNQTAQASSLQQELDKVMAASDSVSEVPATVSANQAPLPNGSQALWVVVHLDVGRLKFDSHSGRHSQELLFVCALLDDQGQIVTGKESRMNLTLKDASFARLSKSGITAKNFLQAQPGRYRLREVVQEGLQGKLFASTTPIEIH